MFLAPVKTLYNMKFYLESLKKSSWKAVLFLIYLFAISVVILSLVISFAITPKINQSVNDLLDEMPEMSISEGIIEVNNNQPLKVSPAGLNGFNILFDTGRTVPVYPTEMNNDKTIILVDSNKVYFAAGQRFEQIEIPKEITTDITRETLAASKEPIANIALAAVLTFMFISQAMRLPFLVIIAWIVVAIVGKTMRADAKTSDYFKLACYFQGPAILIMVAGLFVALPGILLGLAYLAVFIIYAQVVFNTKRYYKDNDLTQYTPVQEQEEYQSEQQETQDDTENN